MSETIEARARLTRLAEILVARGQTDCARTVLDILPLMIRRPLAKRRAPVKSRAVDEDMADEIRAYCRHYPEASQVEVARHFRTNPGRISEALHGDR